MEDTDPKSSNNGLFWLDLQDLSKDMAMLNMV